MLKDIIFIKDQNLLFETAVTIDELLKDKLLKQKAIKYLFDQLVDQMRQLNRKEKDEQLMELLFRCFESLDLKNNKELYIQ